MPVKPRLSKAEYDALAPPERFAYKQTDAGFVVDLEGGYVPPEDVEKLAEFRNSNRELNRLKTELEARLKEFEGIDPQQAREAIARLQGADEHAQKLAEVTAQLEREQQAHRAAKLTHAVTAAFLAQGGRPEASDYIVQKAAQAGFAIDADGTVTTAAVGPDGAPTTLEAWLSAPELAWTQRPSRGGGAFSSGNGTPPAAPRISGLDPLEFGKHAEKIAKGEMGVG